MTGNEMHWNPRENYGGFGSEWQNRIYQSGAIGNKPNLPIHYEQLQEAARLKLSTEAYNYAVGGAGSEDTIRENGESFRRWRIVPKMLTDINARDTRIELFGKKLPAPVLLAPIGVLSIIHPDGELAAARASASIGVPFILSTVASHSIEQVAQVMGDKTRWFQLYYGRDKEVNASLVSRAEASGYSAIVVTVDLRILAWRERDLQRAYLPFFSGAGTANYLTDPVFKSRLDKTPEQNVQNAVVNFIGTALDQTFSWEHVKYLREATKLPLLLKGILRPEDARKAFDLGVDGIVVSNHGGRQVDGSISSLGALPSILNALKENIPVLFDSGIRRGADAIKALALGAKAVLLGRPYLWGLALEGEAGVREVVQNFLADFDLTLATSGCQGISDLNQELLAPNYT